jgi:HAD superfamily hydrolase (TIGR01509 family)
MLAIFDCDGVLLDSEVIFCAVDAEALTGLGHKTTALEIAERFAGIPHRQAWRDLAEQYDLQLPDLWVDDILKECDRRFATQLQPINGAAEAIAEVTTQGHAVCVASSTALDALRANLARTGMLERLDPHVFSVSQVKRSKPAPDVLLFAASQMGFDPGDCIVIEDSVAGVTAARRAGMTAIGFMGGGHAYAGLAARLLEAGAAQVCATMADLSDLTGRLGAKSRL